MLQELDEVAPIDYDYNYLDDIEYGDYGHKEN